MQHDGRVLCTVLADIFRPQSVGQVEVALEGPALPLAADGIGQLEVQLRPVERSVAFGNLVWQAKSIDGLFQRAFGFVPDLIRAHPDVGTR